MTGTYPPPAVTACAVDAGGVAVAGATLFCTIVASGERTAAGDEEDFAVNGAAAVVEATDEETAVDEVIEGDVDIDEALVDAVEDVDEINDITEDDCVVTAGMSEVDAWTLLDEAISCSVAAIVFP